MRENEISAALLNRSFTLGTENASRRLLRPSKTMTEKIAGACIIIIRALMYNAITVEPSVRTPLFYGQFPMSRQNSHIFSF